jgi:23S rRNA pseudouridine1911/1915/1917 synthase
MRVMSARAATQACDYSPERERLIPPELAGLRLDQALARLFPEHSRTRLQAWIRAGRVTVDATRGDVKRKVWGGERVALADERASSDGYRPQPIALAIVHEDAALLVVDKPPGLVVHPGHGNREGTLANALVDHAPGLAGVPRAGIVHRLDKDTSGLLVVAKTPEAQTNLVRQLAARAVKREYLALVRGAVAADGHVDAPIGRHPIARTRMAVTARGKPARSRYRVLERFAGATLLAVTLDTGRTHQIRVHMQAIGHPLVGDPTYGSRARATGARVRGADPLGRFPRQALHAARLGLVHPATGRDCEWRAPVPSDFAALLERLRG